MLVDRWLVQEVHWCPIDAVQAEQHLLSKGVVWRMPFVFADQLFICGEWVEFGEAINTRSIIHGLNIFDRPL